MRNSETRLIADWVKVEYSDINDVNSIGIDELPEMDERELNQLMGIKKKSKLTRYNDISADIALLSGHEIDVETNTIFGKRTEKEFVMQPFRSVEDHETMVKEMERRGYAFDPMGGVNSSINEPDKFSQRELAPVAQAIFGIMNEMENKRSIHKRER